LSALYFFPLRYENIFFLLNSIRFIIAKKEQALFRGGCGGKWQTTAVGWPPPAAPITFARVGGSSGGWRLLRDAAA